MTIFRPLFAASVLALFAGSAYSQVKPRKGPAQKVQDQTQLKPKRERVPSRRGSGVGKIGRNPDIKIPDQPSSAAQTEYANATLEPSATPPHLHTVELGVESVGPIRAAGERPIRRRTMQRYFDGFIYPSNKVVANRFPHGAFELDAPIATSANPDVQYYAFGLGLKHKANRNLEVSFEMNNVVRTDRNFEQQTWKEALAVTAGDCGPTLDVMHRRSFLQTGVQSYAAYDARTDQALADGKAVYWESCQSPRDESDRYGNEISHIVVLVPTHFVGSQSHMNIRTTTRSLTASRANQSGGFAVSGRSGVGGITVPSQPRLQGAKLRPKVSPELKIPLLHSKPMMAVIGDSMSWGQGLSENEKYYKRVADDISPDMDISVFARSGARTLALENEDAIAKAFGPRSMRLRSIPERGAALTLQDTQLIVPTASDTRVDPCEAMRDTHGEVPGATPSTPCQVAHSSQIVCSVTRPNGPTTKFDCSKTTPNFPRLDGVQENNDRSGDFMLDIRARYDYAILSSCMNDLGAIGVIFGLDDEESLRKIAAKTERLCDLRNGLGEIRRYYPNALVMVTDYHRYVTDDTFLKFCYAGSDLLAENAQDRLAVSLSLLRLSIDSGTSLRTERSLRGAVSTADEFIRGTFTESIELAADIAGLRDLDDRNLELPMSKRLDQIRSTMRRVRQRNLNRGDRSSIQGRSNFSGGRGVITLNDTRWSDSDGVFGSTNKSFGVTCGDAVPDLIESVGDRDFDRIIDILGRVQAEDEDRVAETRQAQCASAHFGDPLFGSADQLLCKIASAGHPNPDGAERIADAIIEKIRNVDGLLSGTNNNGLSPSGTNLRRLRR